MGTGLADEPGDTNGLRRFGTILAVFVSPGIIAAVIAYRAMRAHDRASRSVGHSFPPLTRVTQKGRAVKTFLQGQNVD